MRSKPVSQSSPETGDARPEDAAGAAGDDAAEAGADAGAGAGAGADNDAAEPGAKARVEPRAGKGVQSAQAAQAARSREKRAKDGAPANANAKDAKDAQRGPGPLRIELEVSRNRLIGWTVFGLVFGGLLVWKLGTVGVWVGVVLMVLGALRGWQLLQTFLHQPGTIVVTDDEVTLPRGLCVPRPVKVRPKDVTAVYFLRRSVPWNRSAPVLVVELGPRAMAFPRDWFASEADQRHVVHALMRTRGVGPAVAAPAETAEPAR